MLLDKIKMEFICSFIFLFFTGMAAINVFTKATDLQTMSTIIFFMYMILTWVSKSISLAQLNPIITISLIISGHIKWFKGIFYVLAHFISAIFAGSLIKLCIPNEILTDISNNILGIPFIEINIMKAIMLETIGGFFISFIYYTLLLERNASENMAGPALGGVMFILNTFLFNKTGAGLNPAKMLGFSIISNNYDSFYVYLIGPTLGGICGGLLGNMLLSEKAYAYKIRIQKERKKKRRMINLKKKAALNK